MKKFFRVLTQSFYSKELYQDATYKWEGAGFGLLALLSLFSIILFCVSLLALDTQSYSKFKHEIIGQFPQITIKDGHMSADAPMPHYFEFEGKKFAKMDTTPAAEAMSLDAMLETMKKEELFVFATATKVIMVKENGEMRIMDLNDPEIKKEEIAFGPAEVASVVKTVEIFAIPFIALTGFGFLLLYRIVQMLLYSIVTTIVASVMKIKLPSNALQRITTCALFPSAVLYLAFLFAGEDIPVQLSIITTLVFIIFGVKSAKLAAPAVTQ